VSDAAAVPARISPTAVFKKPDFVLMWLAQLVSTAGSALTDLAAGIYVYSVTGSAFLVGVTLMATAIPSLVVGLIAGVFVDRWDRRKVMMASNLAQGVVVATIPFLLGVNVALLFVAILVNAGVKQFFDPAYEALIPEIASDDELTAANAFLQIASFGSTAIGFAGAGLLASIDIRLAFWIDALTFVFSAGCIYLMKTRVKMEVPDGKTSVGVVIANLKTGVRTIWDTPMLRSLFLLGAPAFFAFGLWNVLLLPMAITVLGGTEFQYGIQEALTSVGFVLGSLFMARYAERLQIGLWIFVGMMGMGISGVLYGLSPSITIAIAWVMVSGFFNSPPAVARQTLLQRHTPRSSAAASSPPCSSCAT
jgi:DHA3 family macrolide efflux protein-like MFS transporter